MSRPPRKSPSPLPPPLSVLGEPGASRTQHAIIPPSMPTRYHRDYTFARKTIDGWKFHRYSKFRPLLLRLDQLESSQPRKFVREKFWARDLPIFRGSLSLYNYFISRLFCSFLEQIQKQ